MNAESMTLARAMHILSNVQHDKKARNEAFKQVNKHLCSRPFQAQFRSFGEENVEDAVQNVLLVLLGNFSFTGETEAAAHGFLKTTVNRQLIKLSQRARRHGEVVEQLVDEMKSQNFLQEQNSYDHAREEDERRQEARSVLEAFETKIVDLIAEHAYARRDGRENFIKNIGQMIALAFGELPRESLDVEERVRCKHPDTPAGLQKARDSLNQRFKNSRKRINLALKAVEARCLAMRQNQPPPAEPEPYVTLAAQLHDEGLIPCDKLPVFQRLVQALRQRRASNEK